MRLAGTLNYNVDPPFRARIVYPARGERRKGRIAFRKFLKRMGLRPQTASNNDLGDQESLHRSEQDVAGALAAIPPMDERKDWLKVGDGGAFGHA